MAEKTVSVRLMARVGQYASEMNQAAGVTSNFARSLSGETAKAQRAVTNLGTAAALAGKVTLLGIGAAMVVSAKAAINFESSLTGVAKTTNLAGAALSSFGRDIRDLSLDIPVNANELNRIAELGGQLGVQVPNLINFTKTIAQLGVTTNLSSEEAAVGLARLMNIMGTAPDQVDNLGSVIVELGNNFATTESEILNFALRLAPVGQAVGLSESGVLALGTALSSLGITAERGGTAIQRIFLDMEKAVQDGGEKLQNYADIAGTTAQDFARAYSQDPLVALQMVAGGLDQVVESGGNVFETLDSINVKEQRAIGVALALANGNELLADAYERGNEQIEENNALYEEAALRFGTTESQIALVANAFNDLRIELGNMVIGSGALSGMLDTMKEFLGVARDNADAIGTFAAGLAVLSGLSLVNFFGNLIAKSGASAVGMIRAATAAQGLSRGMMIMRASGLALNAAFGIAGLAALAVGGIWLAQAKKAAELKQKVEELNAALAAGADPLEELTNSFLSELDPRSIEMLQDLTGLSMKDFVQSLTSGGAEAADILADLQGQILAVGTAGSDATTAGGFRQQAYELGLLQDAFEDIEGAVGSTGDIFDAFRRSQLSMFVEEFRELNPETKLTADQIREMGRRIQEMEGKADLSGWAESVTNNLNFIDPAARQAIDRFNQMEGAAEDVDSSLLQHFASLGEEGVEAYQEFTESISEHITTFRDTVSEAFDEISSSLMSGRPAWDEYGEAVELSVSKMLQAREDFLADTRAWVELQPDLIAQASQATIREIDAWTPQEKAAFARLTDAARTELVDGLNAANAELMGLTTDMWGTRMPGVIRDALPELLAGIDEVTSGIVADNPGVDVGDAWMEGVLQVVREFSNDTTIQDELLAYLTDPTLLSNTYNWAAGIGAQVTAGLIYELSLLGGRATAAMNSQMEQIKGNINDTLQISSPSRYMMWVGSMMTEGLVVGINRSMAKANIGFDMMGGVKKSVSRAMPARSLSSVTNTSSSSYRGGDTNINIPVVYPQDKDLVAAVSKARNKIQAIVPMMERSWPIR